MMFDTLFEKFDRLVEAPDAVPCLRRFILDLAVRGKLVEQDSNDEPATELFKQIRAWRNAAIAKKKVRLPRKPLLAIQESEIPYALPTQWSWARLGELIYIHSGDGLTTEAMIDGSIPVFGGNGITGFHDTSNVDQPTIVIGRVGYYCGSVHVTPPNAWVTDNAFITEFCFDAIFQSFLVLLLRATNLKENEGATAQPVISGTKLYPIVVGLPPFAEQRHIVAKVDELMGLCDQLEAAQVERERRWDRLAAASLNRLNRPDGDAKAFCAHARFHLDHLPRLTVRPNQIPALRQTILNLAMRGHLVPQDPNDEPASDLLAKKAKLPDGHQRRQTILKKTSISRPDDLFPVIPKSWEYMDIQSLYDLNVIIDYAHGNHGSLYPRSSEFGDTGVTFVTAKDLVKGRVLWHSCVKLNDARANQLKKGWAKGNDVLLTHNATVGRVARVEPEVGLFLLGTSVTFYRLNSTFLDPGFFFYLLQASIWQGQLEAVMAQTTRNQVSIPKRHSSVS
jgi:type I restriction enzyme S subunit